MHVVVCFANVHGEFDASKIRLHGRGETGDLGCVESATAADRTSHIIRAEMDGEGTGVEDVTTSELGGLVRVVIGTDVSCGVYCWALSPKPADAVNNDVGDWDVEHSTLLALVGTSEEHGLWLPGLAGPGNARVILVAAIF